MQLHPLPSRTRIYSLKIYSITIDLSSYKCIHLPRSPPSSKILCHECTNQRCHVAVATKPCTVEPSICGTSVWSWLHVALLTSRIFRRFLDFWKISSPSFYAYTRLLLLSTHMCPTHRNVLDSMVVT